MKPYPAPTEPGFYWAKLVHPSDMPTGEDWKSITWEVVEVFENCINEADPEYLGVFVGGIQPVQWIPDFIWGPQIIKPDELQ